jgi:hypothetical protein
MTGAASGAGTVYPSGAPEFIPGFLWDSCYSNFSFICMFCRSLLVLLYFFFWPLCCLFFFDIQILITPLVSFGHCVVCFSSIYRFWLPLWYLLAIVLSVLLRYTNSDYLLLVSFGHCVIDHIVLFLLAIVFSVLLQYTDSDYLPLVSSNSSRDHNYSLLFKVE